MNKNGRIGVWDKREDGWLSRREVLCLRAQVLAVLRKIMSQRGYLEVETPCLVKAPTPEAVYQSIQVGDDWLAWSPEFQLKRMIAGGFEKIYRLGPVFRGEEEGNLHNPEFTLLEWGCTGGSLEVLAEDIQALCSACAELSEEACRLAENLLFLNEHSYDNLREHIKTLRKTASWLNKPFLRATVTELFLQHLGIKLLGVTEYVDLYQAVRQSSHPDLQDESWQKQLECSSDFTSLFSALWLLLEAKLPSRPLLITHWPAPCASLARLDENQQALRMELYASGLELANGFDELTDPQEHEHRFQVELEKRQQQKLPIPPLDKKFMQAIHEGLPSSVGMALGVDRLVMLLCGLTNIRDSLAFTWHER